MTSPAVATSSGAGGRRFEVEGCRKRALTADRVRGDTSQRGSNVAIKLGWFAARTGEDLIPVLKKVRPRAAKGDVPEGFHIARCAAAGKPDALSSLKGPFKKSSPAPVFSSAVMLGWQFHAAPYWAQAVSQEIRCVAVSFFVFEGTWNYSIFDSGEEVAAMEVYSLPEPTLYGDVDRAASLFGVEPDLFRCYETALKSAVIEDGDEDEGAGPPAFPGDEYQPHDEWAHLDFARRLGGIRYPDPDEGTEFCWDAITAPVNNTSWSVCQHAFPRQRSRRGQAPRKSISTTSRRVTIRSEIEPTQ